MRKALTTLRRTVGSSSGTRVTPSVYCTCTTLSRKYPFVVKTPGAAISVPTV